MKMDNINSNLILLEKLSEQISDLITNNSFEKILALDSLRQSIIIKIQSQFINNFQVRNKVKSLIKENQLMILISNKKLKELKNNHNKFNKRLEAYSFSK